MENGPVQTGFEVYEDFLHYKSGIYKYTDGIILGGHAVKIVGWGKEGAVNYWIVANSWGPKWGEKGYFRIAFGECTFEENAYVGLPDLKSIKTTTVRDFLK
jgi:cathepsin B